MVQTEIQKLYDNPKAKGFVNHLIKSYLPIHKISKVWKFKKEHNKQCNVCRARLLDVEESLQGFSDNIETIVGGMIDTMRQRAATHLNDTEPPKQENRIVKHITKGRVLAYTGEKTDTCLCLKCSQELIEMVQHGLMMCDANMVYQVKQMQRDQFFNRFDKHPELSHLQKDKVKEIKRKIDKTKTSTFADLDVLKKLKDQMDQNEK